MDDGLYVKVVKFTFVIDIYIYVILVPKLIMSEWIQMKDKWWRAHCYDGPMFPLLPQLENVVHLFVRSLEHFFWTVVLGIQLPVNIISIYSSLVIKFFVMLKIRSPVARTKSGVVPRSSRQPCGICLRSKPCDNVSSRTCVKVGQSWGTCSGVSTPLLHGHSAVCKISHLWKCLLTEWLIKCYTSLLLL